VQTEYQIVTRSASKASLSPWEARSGREQAEAEKRPRKYHHAAEEPEWPPPGAAPAHEHRGQHHASEGSERRGKVRAEGLRYAYAVRVS
jgi:hypothetical protein